MASPLTYDGGPVVEWLVRSYPERPSGLLLGQDNDPAVRRIVHRFPYTVTDFDVSPDGRLLAVASLVGKPSRKHRQVELYRMDEPNTPAVVTYQWPAALVSFAPDGLTLAFVNGTEQGNQNRSLYVVDIAD